MRRISHFLLGAILLGGTASAQAQGRLDRVKDHYVGALDFFDNQPDLKHRVRHPNPAENGLQGNGDGWMGNAAVEVRGLMKSAHLNVDWWTLFGEPIANYTFVWQSSGRYEIRYTDPKKGRVTAIVAREKLTAHPHLLKRFDALAPIETNFEIRWRIGDQSSLDREKFKQKYRLFGSIGRAAPHVKTNMVTRLHDGMLIYERSGKKPFSSPTASDWKTFGSLGDSFDRTKIKMLSNYFHISTGQVVQNFRATKFRWPVGEMKSIAEALARIEAGEEISPIEEAKKETQKQLTRYIANDEWSEAIAPPAPPLPKRADDGLFYFTNAGGDRAFPTGYKYAAPFGTGPHVSALVQSGTTSTGDSLSNYIDTTGKKILPFDTRHTSHLTEGVYYVSDPQRPNAINFVGLYDAVRKNFLLPWQYDTVSMSQQKDGKWRVTTRKVLSRGPARAPKTLGMPIRKVTTEHTTYQWNPSTRTLVQLSSETKTWDANASSFPDHRPLN